MKDTTTLSFLAYTSKSEGCQVVFKRKISDLKRNYIQYRGNETRPLQVLHSKEAVSGENQFNFVLSGVPSLGELHEFYFNVPKFSDEPDNLGDLLVDRLMNENEIPLALSPQCRNASQNIPLIKNLFAFRDQPLWSNSGSDLLPLHISNNMPVLRFTYATADNAQSMRIDMGINGTELLKQLSFNVMQSAVSKIE
jgi:hypothetical protein